MSSVKVYKEINWICSSKTTSIITSAGQNLKPGKVIPPIMGGTLTPSTSSKTVAALTLRFWILKDPPPKQTIIICL